MAVADVLWVETRIRSGHGGPYFPVHPPYRPGVGVAGTVSVVGHRVDQGWVGRRVIARTGKHGGYLERPLVPAGGLVPVPDAVELRDAAALLHDDVTAFGLAEVVRIASGDRTLVTAAGGGLGALLVQLAHSAGGYVVAAARGAQKLEQIRELGADVVVDYSEPHWIDRVRDATDGLDVVLDGAGGVYGRAAFDLVVAGGRYSAPRHAEWRVRPGGSGRGAGARHHRDRDRAGAVRPRRIPPVRRTCARRGRRRPDQAADRAGVSAGAGGRRARRDRGPPTVGKTLLTVR